MIDVNVLTNDKNYILSFVGEDSVVHTSMTPDPNHRYYFLINVTEEEYIFLLMKLGNEYVWKR